MVTLRKIEKRRYYVVFPVIALLLFFAQQVTQVRLLGLVGIAVLAISTFWLEIDQLYCAYALLLPNTFILKIYGTNAALAGFWLLAIVGRIVVTNFRQIPLQRKMVVHIVVHITIVLVSVLLSQNGSLVFSLIRFLCSVLIASYLSNRKTIEASEIINKYVLGCMLNVVLGVVYELIRGNYILMGNFGGINNDRNYFAVTLAFCVSIILACAYKNKRITAIDLVKILVLLAGVLLSASRTGALLMIPSALTMLAILLQKKRNTLRNIATAMALAVGAGLVLTLLGDSLQILIERFSNESFRDGNGRFDSWNYYLGETFASIKTALIGSGSSVEVVEAGKYEAVEHNTLIQMLYTIGILGTLSLLVLYWDIFRLFKRPRKTAGIIIYFPMLIIIIGYCTINGLYSDNLTFALILSAIVTGYAGQGKGALQTTKTGLNAHHQ